MKLKLLKAAVWIITAAAIVMFALFTVTEDRTYSYAVLGLAAAAVVLELIFYRCPACGKFLGSFSNRCCPHCGARVNEKRK